MVWFVNLKVAADLAADLATVPDRYGCAKPVLSLLVTWLTVGLRSTVVKPRSRQQHYLDLTPVQYQHQTTPEVYNGTNFH